MTKAAKKRLDTRLFFIALISAIGMIFGTLASAFIIPQHILTVLVSCFILGSSALVTSIITDNFVTARIKNKT